MEVNKIQEELARLIELVDGWAGSHDVPGIERDLVLDKLKNCMKRYGLRISTKGIPPLPRPSLRSSPSPKLRRCPK
ncbi:MAG: hypothetical protein ACLURY_04440 [Alistipes putredinis]